MRKVTIDVSKLLGFRLGAEVVAAKIGKPKNKPYLDTTAIGAKIGNKMGRTKV